MPVMPQDIDPDEQLARRVLATARTIAPCIDSIQAGSDPYLDAVAILSNVAAEAKARGARHVTSQRVGAAAVTYDVGSAFTDDDRDALRALCAAARTSVDQPAGRFPTARPVGRVWPETY